MKKTEIIMHISVSADGFLATADGDSDWVSPIDCDLFEKRMKEAGCVIVGRKSFDQYAGDLYPVKGIANIVLTHKQAPKTLQDGVFYCSSPLKAVACAAGLGCKTAILAGGAHANGAMLRAGLIDEIFLTVHPLILGSGMKLFEDAHMTAALKLLDTRKLGEGLVELHYRVAR